AAVAPDPPAPAGWRQPYVAASLGHAVLAVLALAFLNQLTFGQKVEIGAIAAGTVLLLIGHIGWYREREHENEFVSAGLLFGSLLVSVPFLLTVVALRLNRSPGEEMNWFSTFNEIGALAAGLLLFGTGYACRIRAPTIMGTILLVVYILTLVLYVRIPHRLQNVAVYMIIGGAGLFRLGLPLGVS